MNSLDVSSNLEFRIYYFYRIFVIISFSAGKLRKNPFVSNKKFVFFFNCSSWEKLVKKIGEKNCIKVQNCCDWLRSFSWNLHCCGIPVKKDIINGFSVVTRQQIIDIPLKIGENLNFKQNSTRSNRKSFMPGDKSLACTYCCGGYQLSQRAQR